MNHLKNLVSYRFLGGVQKFTFLNQGYNYFQTVGWAMEPAFDYIYIF